MCSQPRRSGGYSRDALVAAGGRRLKDLPEGAKVGTSSPRRVTLLRAVRPNLEVTDIRGNVDTRLRRVADGDFDAVLLAAAGLARLGRLHEATQLFEAMEFLPAPGQGVIALECRADDDVTRTLLAQADHQPTRAAVEAERGFLGARHRLLFAHGGLCANRRPPGSAAGDARA